MAADRQAPIPRWPAASPFAEGHHRTGASNGEVEPRGRQGVGKARRPGRLAQLRRPDKGNHGTPEQPSAASTRRVRAGRSASRRRRPIRRRTSLRRIGGAGPLQHRGDPSSRSWLQIPWRASRSTGHFNNGWGPLAGRAAGPSTSSRTPACNGGALAPRASSVRPPSAQARRCAALITPRPGNRRPEVPRKSHFAEELTDMGAARQHRTGSGGPLGAGGTTPHSRRAGTSSS